MQFAARCKEIELRPVKHTEIREDDELVTELKERRIRMEQEYRGREKEMIEGIKEKEAEIHNLQQEIISLRKKVDQMYSLQEHSSKATQVK